MYHTNLIPGCVSRGRRLARQGSDSERFSSTSPPYSVGFLAKGRPHALHTVLQGNHPKREQRLLLLRG